MAVQHLSPGNQPWHVGYRMLGTANVMFCLLSILYPKLGSIGKSLTLAAQFNWNV